MRFIVFVGIMIIVAIAVYLICRIDEERDKKQLQAESTVTDTATLGLNRLNFEDDDYPDELGLIEIDAKVKTKVKTKSRSAEEDIEEALKELDYN